MLIDPDSERQHVANLLHSPTKATNMDRSRPDTAKPGRDCFST